MLLLEKTETMEKQTEVSGISYTKEIQTFPGFPLSISRPYNVVAGPSF